MAHWVAAGFMLQQFCDSFDYCGRFFCTDVGDEKGLIWR
jgi:hypothetical protein